ncbi:putative ferrous iron binding protein [Podospora australis]|uniref:Ferrous iron binding protein n=1 Tax=Podospora australis TaxID=1536484 RepID=A0AAN6WVN2_9PEZI|nr:putative ferrous iron binding protein [Podospora australis]
MFDTWVLRRPTFFVLPTLVILLAILTSSFPSSVGGSSMPPFPLSLAPSSLTTTLKGCFPRLFSTISTSAVPRQQQSSTMTSKLPVYFFSHGGPDVQYKTSHPVYPVLQSLGREITSLQPKALVVFSAHWQSPSESLIQLNSAAGQTPLIYDFYGFPPEFYQAAFPSEGNPQLASRILSLLSEAGIQAQGVSRGIDHGVFSGFNVAFDPKENPLHCPLVQVSLFASEDPDAHYRLGQAVQTLREEGVVMIGTGMTVHNLRDMRFAHGSSTPLPYSVSFDNALKEAVEVDPKARQEKMREVTKRPDARQAHPWMDHLMPVYVAAGAGGEDKGKQIWTLQEASFAWAQYRFGELPSEE